MFRRTLKVWLCLLQGSANTEQTDNLQRTEKSTEDLETWSLGIFQNCFLFYGDIPDCPDDALMSLASDAHAQTVNHPRHPPPEWGGLGPLPTPLFHHVRAACYFYTVTHSDLQGCLSQWQNPGDTCVTHWEQGLNWGTKTPGGPSPMSTASCFTGRRASHPR